MGVVLTDRQPGDSSGGSNQALEDRGQGRLLPLGAACMMREIPTSITSLSGKTLSGALLLLAKQWRWREEESSHMNLGLRPAELSRTVKLVNLSHPEEGLTASLPHAGHQEAS